MKKSDAKEVTKMKKRLLALLLVAIMPLSLTGCVCIPIKLRQPKEESTQPSAYTTALVTTTTTAAEDVPVIVPPTMAEDMTLPTQQPTIGETTPTAPIISSDEPLVLLPNEGGVDGWYYADTKATSHNASLLFMTTTALTNLRFIALNPDLPTVGETLSTVSYLAAGESWVVDTYINDTIPNRGVACTDENGKTYYYAITYSMRGDAAYPIRLTRLDITDLSTAQMQQAQALLNLRENIGFLSMNEYTCPEEASLTDILYDGAGIGVGSWEWTEEEQNDFLAAAGWEEWYISATRYARADVEALIDEKLGIPLAALENDLLYIEKYDAYYHAHSDTQMTTITVLDGVMENNYYILDYTGCFNGKGRVVLQFVENGYRFVSNVEIKE